MWNKHAERCKAKEQLRDWKAMRLVILETRYRLHMNPVQYLTESSPSSHWSLACELPSFRTPSRMALRPLGLCRHRPPDRRPLSTPPIRASTGHTSLHRATSLGSDRDRQCAGSSPESSPSLSFFSLSKYVGLRSVGANGDGR